MSAIFLLDQVLACMESATLEYSTTSQCLSAPLGRPGRVKFILNGLRWKKNQRTYHAYTTIVRRLAMCLVSGRWILAICLVSAHWIFCNVDQSARTHPPLKKKSKKKTRRRKPSGSRSQVPPMATRNHGLIDVAFITS